ncbi:hypothetical protein [Pedococcus soli]
MKRKVHRGAKRPIEWTTVSSMTREQRDVQRQNLPLVKRKKIRVARRAATSANTEFNDLWNKYHRIVAPA